MSTIGHNRKLRKDLTTQVESKVTEALWTLVQTGFMDGKLKTNLTPQYSTPLQLYGTPKIHKADTHMCLTIGSPHAQISQRT